MATTAAETILMKAGAQPSLIKKLANRYGLEEGKFYNTIISVIWPTREKDGKISAPAPEQVAAFLLVCDEFDLSPFLREIYPFIDKGGNLKIIVGIDGWIKIVQRHPEYDGHKFQHHLDDDKKLFAVTCTMHRRDRQHPIEMTEYLHECRRETDPWKQWPSRMLSHRAFIQTARYAFGMSGIVDEDEADREVITVRTLEEPKRLSASSEASTERAQFSPGDAMQSAQQDTHSDAPIDDADTKRLNEAIFKAGLSKADFNGWLKQKYGFDRLAGLRKSQVAEVLAEIPKIKF
jgi:phage recombination protein Bet